MGKNEEIQGCPAREFEAATGLAGISANWQLPPEYGSIAAYESGVIQPLAVRLGAVERGVRYSAQKAVDHWWQTKNQSKMQQYGIPLDQTGSLEFRNSLNTNAALAQTMAADVENPQVLTAEKMRQLQAESTEALQEANQEFDRLLALNPGLAKLKLDRNAPEQMADALMGVSSQFNADDIQFYLSDAKAYQNNGNYDCVRTAIEEGTGVDVEWMPSPETLQNIWQSLKQRRQPPKPTFWNQGVLPGVLGTLLVAGLAIGNVFTASALAVWAGVCAVTSLAGGAYEYKRMQGDSQKFNDAAHFLDQETEGLVRRSDVQRQALSRRQSVVQTTQDSGIEYRTDHAARIAEKRNHVAVGNPLTH